MLQNLNFQEHGVEIKSELVSNDLIQSIISEISVADQVIQKYGVRNAEKRFSSISNLINSDVIIDEAKRILGKKVQVVRVIFFDKTPEKNWLVTWHQDKTVALNQKFDLDGWGRWTLKDGTHHVQPPVEVLDQMITFRLHLDPANDENGCLKVIPSSHENGILKQKQIDKIVSEKDHVSCVVNAGDAVIMRPHILHASSKAIVLDHRRIVHVEFSSFELPVGICWA